MHLSSAAAGTLVLALTIGALGCRAPTELPDEPAAMAPAVSRDAVLIVRAAHDDHWLRPGDSVSVSLTLHADEGAAAEGRMVGTLDYRGHPLWAAGASPAGEYSTTYFSHDAVPDHVIGLFFGADIARGRLILFVRPEPFAVTWIVTASGPGGEPVELARGDGVAAQ
jgi:hypothetical protein